MAHFFRDQQLKNSTFDEDSIRQIAAVLQDRNAVLNARVPENRVRDEAGMLSYVIRFDNKGYRLVSLDELLRHFNQAEEVERVFFNIDTGDSLGSGKQIGTFVQVGLDARDWNRCLLEVTSNDGEWVDATIAALQEVLARRKNRNGWVRTAWMQMAVQLVGVSLGFVICLWVAAQIAPKLAVENAFIITFLFLLLMFSNVWLFLNQRILFFVNGLFPNIEFYRPRKNRMHWLMQRVVGTIIIAVAVYLVTKLASVLGDVLSGFIRKSP
jgi:hypothetical protein